MSTLSKIALKPKIPIGIKKDQQTLISTSEWFLEEPIENYAWKPEGIYTNASGETFLLPNNKQFANWINKKYAKYKMSDDIKNTCQEKSDSGFKPPFLHQQFVTEYMLPTNPYRGLLLDHDLGSGKTRTAIATAENYRKLGIKILILLPATLKPTWMNELKTWGNEDIRRPTGYENLSPNEKSIIDMNIDQKIATGYKFVSYNAANTLDLLKTVVGGELKHHLVIADEVHNLISMMVNPTGKKGLKLYQTLMNAIDCKFLFLSATPLLNTPFELGIMFNILRGYMTYKNTKYTLFPENEAEFEEYFIDYETKKIRNPELFKKRIIGLVSYYYGAKGDVYPELVMQPPSEIEFSDYHFNKYSVARLAEIEKEAKSSKGDKQKLANLSGVKTKPTTTGAAQVNKAEVKSTFRIFSRQFSNYVFPEKIKRPLPNDFSGLIKLYLNFNPNKWTEQQVAELLSLFDDDMEQYNKFVENYKQLKTDAERLKYLQTTIEEQGKDVQEFSNITSDEEQFIYQQLDLPASYQIAIDQSLKLLDAKKELYFKEMLDCLGPKMDLMYRNIMEGEGAKGPAFVYSQFRTLEGVNMFARVLQAHNFEPLPYNEINASNIANYVGKNRYVVYSGEEDNQIRNKILWIFNNPLNKHGEICKVFMGTAAAAEGISLKNTRQVHILEPYWNEVRIQQVIGRARRICSHEGLPKAERKVYVYRYHMVLTQGQKEKFVEAESTDQAIYRIAKVKEAINSQFLQILKDAAVDCKLNAYHNITANNPIQCFSFDEKETGIAFYPNLGEESTDELFMINYAHKAINFAVFNLFGPSDERFYQDGDYLYVYKYVDNPTIIKKEKIKIISKNIIIPATVLYDKVIAQSGNMFVPKKAFVNKLVFPSNVFELVT